MTAITSDPWGFIFGTFSDAFNFTMNNRSVGDMINPAPSGREMGYIYANIFGKQEIYLQEIHMVQVEYMAIR